MSNAMIQIPNRVKDVGLLNRFMLLDKILRPNTKSMMNGNPTKTRAHIANNQCGSIDPCIKGGSSVNSSPKPKISKLPIENRAKINEINTVAETMMMITPINFPMILKNTVIILPNVSRNS